MQVNKPKRTRERLSQLRRAMVNASSMLIVLQDNPDPDALASAAALRKLANALAGVSCSIACGGSVGRAENRAMVRYLSLNILPVSELDTVRYDLLALVDTQPGHGNTTLPETLVPDIVIDHHPHNRQTREAAVTDIRRTYGATSTILYEYLACADVEIDVPLATALLYGIRSDTQDLGREATQADIAVYEALYRRANKRALGIIQRGQVPTEYFRVVAQALSDTQLCDASIFASLGDVDTPDMVSEVADLLLRHEQVRWSLCWAYCDRRAFLSLRTVSSQDRADRAIRYIVARKGTGGGHETVAGGQIMLPGDASDSPEARDRLDRLIRRRFLKATGATGGTCHTLI